MKYPILHSTAISSLTVNSLNGGINLRESESNILDNQLTDCKNMIFSDGELKTRSGIANTGHLQLGLDDQAAKITPHEVFLQLKNSKKARVISVYMQSAKLLKLFLFCENELSYLAQIECSTPDFFITQYQNTLYLFLEQNVYTLNIGDTAFTNVNDKIYVPLVAVDCKYSGGGFSGVFNESYNLLGDSYKIQYTTKNPDWHSPLTDTVLHEMTYLNYFFETDYKKYAGKAITAELLDSMGNVHTHSVVLNSNGNGSETTSTDGLYMSANINGITFFTDPEHMNIAYKYKTDDQIQNDLTITFPTLYDKQKKDKVFKSTFCTWFGGGKGIYGGSRLFLGGNKNEGNLVIWSDLNNPLYFPENSYFYVGSHSFVTAFALQSDMLVIFKENEVYFTKYAQNAEITAEQIISGQVTDYIAQSVYFPLTLINSTIGCDCPNTVILCRNRLVWTTSCGRVYTLVSSDKYSENNIYQIGQLIHKKLSLHSDLQQAVCADFDGKYLLLTKQSLYVFNYNCYGYQNVAGYTKTEDANLKTEWYFCTLPISRYKNAVIFCIDSSLYLLAGLGTAVVWGEFLKNKAYDSVIDFDENGFFTYQTPIENVFKTKQYVFNQPFNKKDILSTFLSVKAELMSNLELEYIGDNFTKSAQLSEVTLSNASVQNIKLLPLIKQTCSYGLRVKANGFLSVGALNIKAKITKGD